MVKSFEERTVLTIKPKVLVLGESSFEARIQTEWVSHFKVEIER